MKKSRKERLNNIITKGKWHYILVHGVLLWGVSTAILFSIIWHFIGLSGFNTIILPSLLLFPLGGVLWGLIMWFIIKREHSNTLKTDP